MDLNYRYLLQNIIVMRYFKLYQAKKYSGQKKGMERNTWQNLEFLLYSVGGLFQLTEELKIY